MRIAANGHNFHVVVEGEGEPVLLLHGFPDSLKLWRNVAAKLLEQNYKVITFDQRGFGESDAPSQVSDYKTDHIIEDAAAILKELGYSSGVKLIGHDWGSFIGWMLCLKYPELIDRYVAVSVGHPLAYRYAGWEQKFKAWYILAFQLPFYPEARIRANDWAALRCMNASEAENWIADLARAGRLSAALNWYRANFFNLLAAEFKKCKVPTLGVYSYGDIALTEKQMTDSAKYMEAPWRYCAIKNSSHWIPLDQPEQLARLCCDWFKERL
jgi:pimeloyl-ACP methyl ester carboxylesterase